MSPEITNDVCLYWMQSACWTFLIFSICLIYLLLCPEQLCIITVCGTSHELWQYTFRSMFCLAYWQPMLVFGCRHLPVSSLLCSLVQWHRSVRTSISCPPRQKCWEGENASLIWLAPGTQIDSRTINLHRETVVDFNQIPQHEAGVDGDIQSIYILRQNHQCI
jgi:hypothetical protein